MAVLVTGGAGFIGSHVVDALLAAGEDVVALDNFDPFYDRTLKEANLAVAMDNPAFRLVEGDIRDPGGLAALPGAIDTVVHLAALAGVRPSIAEPARYADVNLMGTAQLLEFARARGIRAFVLASSSSVYGNNDKVPFAESDPVDHPISPYAATKKSAEMLCHAAGHLNEISTICLRFFTVYGPRQRPDLAIRKFSRLLLQGAPLPRYGDGSTARDYTYIDDTVAGVLAAIGRARSVHTFDVINLGEARAISLSEMIDTLAAAFDREPLIDERPMQPGDVTRTYADITHAAEVLGYRPEIDFEDGIARFAQWYLETGAAEDGVRSSA